MIKPRAIALEASSFCQLRCPSCTTTTRKNEPVIGRGFLSLSNFRDLLDKNPSLRKVELSNYGEIFLNPELVDILKEAYGRGVEVSATNGANMNSLRPEALEGVVRYRLRKITCSIDGASDETYRQYRRRGNFDRVIGNIRAINAWKEKLGSRYPQLVWQFVVFGHNEHEIGKARRMAKELGMRFVTKLNWDPKFSPIRDLEMVRRETRSGVATRAEYKASYGSSMKQATCHHLWDRPQINWDGKLLGCSRNVWGDFGGNAFTDGLKACINNEKIVYAREMLRGRRPPRDDIPCTSCENYLHMKESGRFLDRGLALWFRKAIIKTRKHLSRYRRPSRAAQAT